MRVGQAGADGLISEVSTDDAEGLSRQPTVREQWGLLQEARGQALAGSLSGPQDAPAQRRVVRDVEKGLWYWSQQRRAEFGDLLSRYNRALSGCLIRAGVSSCDPQPD